jgi:hypothetical protein
LLLKRLKIGGIPADVINLLKVWLEDWPFYVIVDGDNSVFYDLLLGAAQGLILCPVIIAIYMSPTI